MIEPAVIDLVLRALPDPVALVESAVRRGRMQHRLQWATPAFASLADIPHPDADISDLPLGGAGDRPVVHRRPPHRSDVAQLLHAFSS